MSRAHRLRIDHVLEAVAAADGQRTGVEARQVLGRDRGHAGGRGRSRRPDLEGDRDLDREGHSVAGGDHQGAGRATLIGGQISAAAEIEHIACIGAEIDPDPRRVTLQPRGYAAESGGVGDGELAVAGLVILRIGADRRRRGDDHLCRQGIAESCIGRAERAGGDIGAIGQPDGVLSQSRLGPELDAVGARLQCIGRRHQSVGAGRQVADRVGERDLLADRRHGGISGHRRVGGCLARHQRIDLRLRRAVGVGRIGIDQCGAQHIDRAAAPGDKPGPGQRTAAGDVDQRTRFGHQRCAVKGDAAAERCQIEEISLLCVVEPGQSIHGAAIGHRESLGADRGDAAGAERDMRDVLFLREIDRVIVASPCKAEIDRPEWCADDAVLMDRRRIQGQRPERGQRHSGVVAEAIDRQRPVRIAEAKIAVQADVDLAGTTGDRIKLRRVDGQIRPGHIDGRRVEEITARIGRIPPVSQSSAAGEANIAATIQHHMFEAGNRIIRPFGHLESTE